MVNKYFAIFCAYHNTGTGTKSERLLSETANYFKQLHSSKKCKIEILNEVNKGGDIHE